MQRQAGETTQFSYPLHPRACSCGVGQLVEGRLGETVFSLKGSGTNTLHMYKVKLPQISLFLLVYAAIALV